MEYVRGYNLTSHLKHDTFKMNKNLLNDDCFGSYFTEVKASHIIKQILEGLAFLHMRQLCHRDIKLDNIMFDVETGLVKIIDFGFVICCTEPLNVYCGTPSYMSPEIVAKKPYRGPEADVWAAGVVMFAILTGTLPFKSSDKKTLYRKI